MNMKLEKYYPCQIPTLKLSCYGCCGNSFKSQQEVLKQIKDNTQTYSKIKIKTPFRLLQYRDRIESYTTPSGVCQNLVEFKNQTFACPLHKHIQKIIPKQENTFFHKKDLREHHCDQNYECETFIFYTLLSQIQKQEYIKWLSTQKIDNHYQYSMKNHDAYYIKKFMDVKNYKL